MNTAVMAKLRELSDEIIKNMTEEEKEKAHKELTKKLIGDFVDNIHRTNCMFGFGGVAEAAIVTGTVTYNVRIEAENSTEEHLKLWQEGQNTEELS